MKVFQEAAKVVKLPLVADNGARVGDKIIFSSHNPKNRLSDDWMVKQCAVTFNKVYIITDVVSNSRGVRSEFINDVGTITRLGSDGYHGEFDIIEAASLVEPAKPEFQPVTLTLETQGEVDLIKGFFGALHFKAAKQFGLDYRSLINSVYDSLPDDFENRKLFKTIELQ
jgi:hypothetical protein